MGLPQLFYKDIQYKKVEKSQGGNINVGKSPYCLLGSKRSQKNRKNIKNGEGSVDNFALRYKGKGLISVVKLGDKRGKGEDKAGNDNKSPAKII